MQERRWPGLCCFEKEELRFDLYCFCGVAKRRLKTIEKYDCVIRKWVKLETDESTLPTFNLRAVSMKDEILVFGGDNTEDSTMVLYDENGRMKKTLCDKGFIPLEQGE